MKRYDLMVIGSGKGGKSLAMKFAKEGKRVALVERSMVGGSCINVACIPTKTLVKSAKVYKFVQEASKYGVQVAGSRVDPEGVLARKNQVVSSMVERNRNGFFSAGIDLIMGQAHFIGDRTVHVQSTDLSGTVGDQTIQADKVVINTGCRPIVPDIPGLALCDPLTSESILQLDRIPEHLIIIGGGYIGCEFAQIYRRFGSKVTILDRNTRFLPKEDSDIGKALQEIFEQEGIEILLGAQIKGVSGQCSKSVQLQIERHGDTIAIDGTDLLVALGREPNTRELELTSTGIELDPRGYIRVNDRLETTAQNVWAVGDVTGGPQFTHVSWDDYRILSENLEGGTRSTKDRVVPYTLFTDPELGRVGLTCEQAIAEGRSIRIASMPASAIPRAMTSGETRGLLKAAIDTQSDQILGASILCAEAGEILAVIQIAMLSGMTASKLKNVVFSHPTMSESINEWLAQ